MSIREIEQKSIEAYLRAAAKRGLFRGEVLDFGCGKQPYRKIVEEADAKYRPYDRVEFPATVTTTSVGDDYPLVPAGGEGKWDAILCTQVLQYVPRPHDVINGFWWSLKPGGHVVITAPTNWPVVERDDRMRFTLDGLMRMLAEAGFVEVDGHYRASVQHNEESWPLGVGVIAKKPL